MPLDPKLHNHLKQALAEVDHHGTTGPRLTEDAQRLWRRVQRLLGMKLVTATQELDALELSCLALQLPLRHVRALPMGTLGQTNLRDRAEQSAELLVSLLAEKADESLLDRTTRLLHELPQRAPMLDEARLLADAVNLEDFGMIGLLLQTIQIARQGGGVGQVAQGCEKREQYGYWEARLKEGFHFEPARQIARKRLDHARKAAKLLIQELDEEKP